MNSALRRSPLVPRVDRAAPLQFLRTAYDADDWIAVFLKHYETGEAVQRVGPTTMFQQPTCKPGCGYECSALQHVRERECDCTRASRQNARRHSRDPPCVRGGRPQRPWRPGDDQRAA